MSSSQLNAFAIVEQLFQHVKTVSDPNVDPVTAWKTKVDIENACDRLLISTLGRIEYTTTIAGTHADVVTASENNIHFR